MGFFSGVKRVTKPLVNAPKWMDAERLTEGGGFVVTLVERLFHYRAPEVSESFEEALVRLNLTEDDIAKRRKEFSRLVLIFVVVSILVFAYGVDMAINGSWRGTLLCTVVFGIALTQVFRYHFWLYQIKTRRLGATFAEYVRNGLLGGKA